MSTYYVSSSYTGSTSNGGLSTPWKTLSQVNSNMATFQPGDSILFKKGDTFSGTLTVTRSGTSGNPITFGAYGTGNKPKFIGTGSTIPYFVYVNSRNYLIFRDWEITDPTIDNNDRSIDAKIQRGFTFDGTSNNCKILSIDMELVGVGAYWVGGTHTMDGCNIGNLRMVVDTDQGYQPGNDDDYGANPLVVSSSDNTITNNYFYDCYADSYDYTVDGGGIELYNRTGPMNNNIIKYNTFVNTGGIFEITGNAANNLFAYNKVINVGAVVYMQSGFTLTNFGFYNNVFVESATPTIPSDINGRLFAGSLTSGSIILRNNVFNLYNGTRVSSSSVIDHQYNVYKVSNGSTVGFTLHGTEISTSAALFTNTVNVNPYLWDFSPLVGSVLINAGTQIAGQTLDFAGRALSNPPEIGILEYVTPTTTTSTSTTSTTTATPTTTTSTSSTSTSSTSSTSTTSTSSTSTTSTTTIAPTTTTSTSTTSTTTLAPTTTTTSSTTTTTTNQQPPITGIIQLTGENLRRRVAKLVWNISVNRNVTKKLERITNGSWKNIYTIPGGSSRVSTGQIPIKLSLTINTFRISCRDSLGNIVYSDTVSFDDKGLYIDV